jgi:hypothetical protein
MANVRSPERSKIMDAEGARELTRRIGSNAGVAVRPVPAGASAGALSLYRWFGGDASAAPRTTEPSPPARRPRPSLRQLRFRGD